MPLPMVHLAIAVDLAAGTPAPAFLLGSLAPDAIHMRDGFEREAKRITHLNSPRDSDKHEQVQDLLARYEDASLPRRAFAAGYAAHLLTDRFWITEVVRPFQRLVPPAPDEAAYRQAYYQEVDQVDFNLYHHAPWRDQVWQRLAQAEASDFAPLLTRGEIDRWRERTLRWFTELKEEPGVQPWYLTDQVVGDFVGRAAVHVAGWFERWGVDLSMVK